MAPVVDGTLTLPGPAPSWPQAVARYLLLVEFDDRDVLEQVSCATLHGHSVPPPRTFPSRR